MTRFQARSFVNTFVDADISNTGKKISVLENTWAVCHLHEKKTVGMVEV